MGGVAPAVRAPAGVPLPPAEQSIGQRIMRVRALVPGRVGSAAAADPWTTGRASYPCKASQIFHMPVIIAGLFHLFHCVPLVHEHIEIRQHDVLGHPPEQPR